MDESEKDFDRLTRRAKGAWPELYQADRDRNGGAAMELLSAEIYAEQDGVTGEAYVIGVLRRAREQRQDIDGIARDRAWLDSEIDAAATAGKSVIEAVSERAGVRPEDVSAYFLAKVVRRMEERAKDHTEGQGT